MRFWLLCIWMMSFVAVSAQKLGGVGVIQSDTSKTDTIAPRPKKEVTPRAVWVNMHDLIMLRPFHHDVFYDIADFYLRDPLSRLDGFIQFAGQTGKPYRRYLNGIPDHYYNLRQWQDPVTGFYSVYMVDPEYDVKYMDTRTPFANIHFTQGRRSLQLLNATASQNITPFLNLTVDFNRRQMEGAYPTFVTDHHNIYASTHFHTLNDRYHGFVTGVFNELNDQVHGGVFQNGSLTFEELFQKTGQRMNLDEVKYIRRQHSIFSRHFYRFFETDSNGVGPANQLQLTGSFGFDQYYRLYNDDFFDTFIRSLEIPVYPHTDTSFVYESMQTSRRKYSAGLSYRFKQPHFEAVQWIEPEYEQLQFSKDSLFLVNEKPGIKGEGRVIYNQNPFTANLHWNAKWANASLFGNSLQVSGDGWIGYGRGKVDTILFKNQEVPDTSTAEGVKLPPGIADFRPLKIHFSGNYNDRNPSILETYYQGDEGLTYSGNTGFTNEKMQTISAGISWEGKRKRLNDSIYDGNLIRLDAFVSNITSPIWYDTAMNIYQGTADEFVQWQGLKLKTNFRFFKRFVLSNELTWQRLAVGSDGGLELWYRDYLPEIYGKTGLFYENRNVKIAAVVRAGVELHWFSGFTPQTLDPVTQAFYPQQALEVPGYARADLILSTRIKRVLIFVKMIHLNENFFLPGYFTIPYYPMYERSFRLGVTWTFFD